MANDSVISLLDIKVKLEPELENDLKVKPEENRIPEDTSTGTGKEASNTSYEAIHSKSPLFYDLYERKS